MTSPTESYESPEVIDLSIESAGPWLAVTVSLSVSEVTVGNGVIESLAVPVATLVTEPASMSACVIVCEAVQVMNAPGARGDGVCGHVTVALSSVTAYGAVRSTGPSFWSL